MAASFMQALTAERDADDDRPIALRRKRRSSTIQRNISHSAIPENKDHDAAEVESSPAQKPTKRVRFSDSRLEKGPSSTGLTPSMRRSSLAPSSRPSSPTPSHHRAKNVARCKSLPVAVMAGAPLSGEVQFAPLRQVLDDRLKRRLRRNHLSEEVNDIDAEKRKLTKASQEIEELKHVVQDRDSTVQELEQEQNSAQTFEYETPDRWDGPHKGARHLEKAPIRPRSRPRISVASDSPPRVAEPDSIVVNQESFDDGGLDDDDLEDFMMVTYQDANLTSEAKTATPLDNAVKVAKADATTQSSLADPAHEREIQLLRCSLKSSTVALENATNHQHRLLTKLHPFISSSTDEGLGDGAPLDNALDHVLTTLALTQSRAEDASAALHALSADIAALGFEGEGTQDMLKTLTEVFRKARLELEYLAPGETVGGFQNSKLVSTLVERVRSLMKRLNDGAKDLTNQKQQEANLRQQFNGALLNIESMRSVVKELKEKLGATKDELKDANNRLRELEIGVDERDRSITKLQHALEGYRKEVKGLEDLINTMETNHNNDTAQYRDEMNKAIEVAKQEIKTEVELRTLANEETHAQRERSHRLAEELSRAHELSDQACAGMAAQVATKEQELATLQQSLLERDQHYKDDLNKRDQQLSSLRDEIAVLRSSLGETYAAIETLKAAKVDLEGRLEDEAQYGTSAVDKMQAEMMRSLARMGEVKNSYLRGAKLRSINRRESVDDDDESEQRGPLTPNSVVRFADVLAEEKGKRMYDSDLGYLEEDTE